jgi:hypothetical protein
VPTFENKGSQVFSVTDAYGRILGFLDLVNNNNNNNNNNSNTVVTHQGTGSNPFELKD